MPSCKVPTGFPTIQTAVTAGCPVVTVLPGTYLERVVIASDVIIEGDGPGVVVNAGGGGRAFTVNAGGVTLRQMTVLGGRAPRGGGILNAGTLTLDRVEVANNTALGNCSAGGGIFNDGGTLNLLETTVRNNTATLGAGQSGCISSLVASVQGGGIATDGGTVNIDLASTVNNNAAISMTQVDVTFGGGILANQADVTIAGASTIFLNHADAPSSADLADARGGGIYQEGGTLTITGASLVVSNSAASTSVSGGGIYLFGGVDLIVADSTISGNTATAEGEVSITNVRGGGMFQGNGTAQFTNATIANNTASVVGFAGSADGGGLSMASVAVTIADSQFTSNRALANVTEGASATAGGASFTGGSLTMSGTRVATGLVRATSIVAYTRASGGGLVVNGGCQASIVETTIDANAAEAKPSSSRVARGAGLSVSGSVATRVAVSRSLIAGNTIEGTSRGAGISAEGDVSIAVTNSTITGNRSSCGGCSLDGGGIYVDSTASAVVELSNATIANNIASRGGGVFLAVTGSSHGTVRARNTAFENIAALGADCFSAQATVTAPLTSEGHNLLADSAGCLISGPGPDIVGISPMLGTLAANGGPTATHALGPGSQAIDAGNPAGCVDPSGAPLTVDQRGQPRPVGPACDIGAYEEGAP